MWVYPKKIRFIHRDDFLFISYILSLSFFTLSKSPSLFKFPFSFIKDYLLSVVLCCDPTRDVESSKTLRSVEQDQTWLTRRPDTQAEINCSIGRLCRNLSLRRFNLKPKTLTSRNTENRPVSWETRSLRSKHFSLVILTKVDYFDNNSNVLFWEQTTYLYTNLCNKSSLFFFFDDRQWRLKRDERDNFLKFKLLYLWYGRNESCRRRRVSYYEPCTISELI